MEVERAIFIVNGGKVIVIADDEVEAVKMGGEQEINIEEWRSVFPGGGGDDGICPDPALTEGGLTGKDWLDLHFDR